MKGKNQKKGCRGADIFGKLYVIGFLIFWFGFLAYGSYYLVKSHAYAFLMFTVPFWIGGISIIHKKMLGRGSRPASKPGKPKFDFRIIVSALLVLSVFAIGIVCLILGVRNIYRADTKTGNYLVFMGLFFSLGALVFVIGALQFWGCFDRFRVDVAGLFIGLVFVVVGAGILFFQIGENGSLWAVVKSWGGWLLIPVMFIAAGVFQVAKCLFSDKTG